MTKRVLLCDDEPPILRAAEFKLKRSGFDVVCACDGQQAWELIQQTPPDILVTDCQMPRMTGSELCQHVRRDERTRNLPVIMLTAKGFEITGQVQAELGISRLMSKPFSPRELLEAVTELLAASAPADRETIAAEATP